MAHRSHWEVRCIERSPRYTTKSGGDAIKEVIGDALRNAAMRFGAALDLWHKGDLHKDAEDDRSHKDGDTLDQPKNFGLTPARAVVVRACAGAALQRFNELDDDGAYGEVEGITDNAERLALWEILKPHSALRAAIKRLAAAAAEREKELRAKEEVK